MSMDTFGWTCPDKECNAYNTATISEAEMCTEHCAGCAMEYHLIFKVDVVVEEILTCKEADRKLEEERRERISVDKNKG